MVKANPVPANRSREQILANMIEVAFSPVNKTTIMYRSSLSYTQLRLYMRVMQENRFLVATDRGQWVATEKGRQFVQAYKALKEILDS